MTEEVVKYEADTKPLQAVELRAQVNLIQDVMKLVMQKGQHYGTVPGCGDKPVLLKAGAEKLMMTFRLAAEPEIIDIPTDDGITFRVICRITNQFTGAFLGSGVGEASTKEEKYNWRKAVCDGEFDSTPEDRRRLKWIKGWRGEVDHQIKQVRTNPADLSNTVLKIAKKRALVDGTLTVTAASDIFTQDIEDMPSEVLSGDKGKSGKPFVEPPQAKADTGGAATTDNVIVITIEKIDVIKSKPDAVKKWTAYILVCGDKKYGTYDKDIYEVASAAMSSGQQVRLVWKQGKHNPEIVSLNIVEQAEGDIRDGELLPQDDKELVTSTKLSAANFLTILKTCKTLININKAWNEYWNEGYTAEEKSMLLEWKEKLMEGLKK